MAMTRKTAEKRLAAVGYLLGHKSKGGPVWAQYEYYGNPGHVRIEADTLVALVEKAEANPRSREWRAEWSRV